MWAQALVRKPTVQAPCTSHIACAGVGAHSPHRHRTQSQLLAEREGLQYGRNTAVLL